MRPAFTNPRNVGQMDGADGVGKVGNPVCGDIMELSLKVVDGVIENAMFRTFGCAAAIATSSMLTELVKGKTIDDALKISNKAVIEALDGLPSRKRHCSVLAEESLQKAIVDYFERRGEAPPEMPHLAHDDAHGEDGGH